MLRLKPAFPAQQEILQLTYIMEVPRRPRQTGVEAALWSGELVSGGGWGESCGTAAPQPRACD